MMTNERVTVFPDEATWLEARKGWIGASESPSILSANPYSSGLNVYCQKVLGAVEPETRKMRAGKELERGIGELWAGEREVSLHTAEIYTGQKGPTVFQAPGKPLACTPDFFALGPNPSLVRPVQVKNVSPELEYDYSNPEEPVIKARHAPPTWRKGPPLHYIVQVQHELMVLRECGIECDMGYLVAFFGGDDVREFEIVPDPELWQMMQHTLLAWWEAHVVAKVPPSPDKYASPEIVRRAWRSSTPDKAVEVSRELVVAYREAKQLAKIHEEAAATAQVALLGALQDAEAGMVDGVKVCTWKTQYAQHKPKEACVVESRPLRLTKGAEAL